MLVDSGDGARTQPATRTAEDPETTAGGNVTTTEGEEPTTDETTTTDEGSAGFPPGADVVDLDTGPRTLALAPTHYRSDDGAAVTVEFAGTATADRPATVRATLTNASDYANTFRLDETPPFAEVADARLRDRRELGYESTWYLVPTADHDLVDDSPDYERGPAGYWRLVGNPAPHLPRTHRLDAGESVAGEWLLLGHGEGSGRPTGRYEFRGHGDASLVVTAWETGAPGPSEQSRFAGATPPSLSDDAGEDATAPHWFHDATAETQVYLEPSAERARTPAKIEFTFHNYGREAATGNPYDWTLYKLVDGEWFRLAPWAIPAPMGSVPPGGTEEWTLLAFSDEGVAVEGATVLDYLGGGRYAFEVGMSGDDRNHAALFELIGPDAEVEPMTGAESARDGATVTVDAPDPDHDQRPATLTLTRADGADQRLVAEQVMRRRLRALRNGLPFFGRDGERGRIERVVVETTENAAQQVVGYDSTTRQFRFDRQAYEARFEAEGSD